MRRARVAVLIALAALAVLWEPALRPAGQGAIIVGSLFGPALVGRDVVGAVVPAPRERESTETIAGVTMRVSWWRPAWGDTHPGLLVVNGATPQGNDNAATRDLGRALARAGFLVMLPEFPFLKEGRLDPAAPRVVDGTLAHLRAHEQTRGRSVGAFGASVGGGLLLSGAGLGDAALSGAAFVAVLGGYFDLDTYFASVASHEQPRDRAVVPWTPSQEARERIPAAAVAAAPEAERTAVRDALAPRSYAEALARIRAVPPGARRVYDALSPERTWRAVRPPIFWLHDPNDDFEPLAEAYAARDAPREGRFTLAVPRLVQHAEVSKDAGAGGPLVVAGEILGLLGFVMEVLRTGG